MMTVFSTLESIRSFLVRDVLPETPAHLRSELRAVIKLLKDVEEEIDALPALLVADCTALLDLADEAEALLPDALGGKLATAKWRQEMTSVPGSLRELVALHDDVRGEAGQILIALQSTANPRCGVLAERYVATAAEHACARRAWQSVFAQDMTEETA